MEDFDISNKLLAVLKEKFDMDYIGKWEDIKGLNLLGHKLCFEPREMVYFLYEIESIFDIKIPEEYIVNGSFNTLSNISSIIKAIVPVGTFI
jgi:peptide maturation system acyl carrier-related protein